MDRRKINMLLPKIICGNTEIPCGKRQKNKACRCEPCGYNIKTTALPLEHKEFLLAYTKIK